MKLSMCGAGLARVAPRDEEEGVWVDVYISDGKTGITEGEYNWRVKRVRLEVCALCSVLPLNLGLQLHFPAVLVLILLPSSRV